MNESHWSRVKLLSYENTKDSERIMIETMTTDEHDWCHLVYIHKEEVSKYTLEPYGESVTVCVDGKIKLGEAN